jgi:hypothetical protein
MPIPTPHKNEKQGEFIPRCMGDTVMKKDYSDQKQRLAVCFSAWRKAKGKRNVLTSSIQQ